MNTTSKGVTRRFGPGQAILFLDAQGKCHAIATSLNPTVLMILGLEDGIAQAANPDLKLTN